MIKEISYGIVPVRDGKVLMLRVYDTWDFPKGKPDGAETPIQTAVREFTEETGLSNPVFHWGEDFIESLPYKKGKKVARYFLALCEIGDVQLLPNPETGLVEHHAFAWLTLEQARDLVKDRLYPVLEWTNKRLSSEYNEQSSVQESS